MGSAAEGDQRRERHGELDGQGSVRVLEREPQGGRRTPAPPQVQRVRQARLERAGIRAGTTPP